MRAAALGVVLLSAVGCRTFIPPIVRTVKEELPAYEGKKKCDVHDYPLATDLPPSAKNLGWVEVPKGETDEDTYIALLAQVCEQGGDAITGLSWVKESGQYEATALGANAWTLP